MDEILELLNLGSQLLINLAILGFCLILLFLCGLCCWFYLT